MRRSLGSGIVLGFLLAGSASAYEEDTHYYLSYLVARLGGMDDRSARVVASAAQAVDDSPATMPYRAESVSPRAPVATSALELARISEALPRWHAMKRIGGSEDEVRARMAELWNQARQGNDLVAFGRFAHFLQDYYSHEKDGVRFSAPSGHLLKGTLLSDLLSEHRWPRDILGHSPDWLSTDPKKAEGMAEAWLARVRLFQKETGRGDPGAKSPSSEKLIREFLGVLIASRQRQLSHADTEAQLNALLKRENLGFEVAPYQERLGYQFDSDGNPVAIRLDQEPPPLPMPSDDLTDREVRRSLEAAARSGELPPPSSADLLESYQVLEQVHLGGAIGHQIQSKLEQLRHRRGDLVAGSQMLQAELEPLKVQVSRLEEDLKNLTELDRGPCACGTATHRQCKSKKTCDVTEAELARLARSKLQDTVSHRDEKFRLLAASTKAVEEIGTEIARWEKRLAAHPAMPDTGAELPEDLRSRLAPGAVLSRKLRATLPGIMPYLPSSARVSSGYRSPERQLELIHEYALKHGVPWDDGATVDRPDTWTQAWRALLEVKGVMINPPVPAKRSDGRLIPASPHTRGDSFDVTGAPLDTLRAALEKARGDGKASFVLLTEPVNDCIHVQLLP